MILAIAQLLGALSVLLLIGQLVLGFRSLASLVTADVLAVNRVHQQVGRYGVPLVLAHPLLLMLASPEPVLAFLAPRFTDAGEAIVSSGKIAFALLAAVWVSSLVRHKRFGFRRWRRLHLVAYVALPLAFVHSLGGASFADGPLRRLWIVVGIGAAGVVVARLLHAAGIGQRTFQVADVVDVARGTRRIVLRPRGRGLRPAHGQFVYVQLRPFGEAHPFTVSHFDDERGELSVTPKAVGPFSRRLHALKPGDRLMVSGPFGVFTRGIAGSGRPVVFIAGGIGITPFLRFLEGCGDALCPPPVTLLYANRTAGDIAFQQSLDNVASRQASIRVVHVLSEATDSSPSPGIEVGYVDDRMLRKHVGSAAASADFFLCGPPPMMNAVTAALERIGAPRHRIHSERFSV